MENLVPLIESLYPRLRKIRHELHANPELGFEETETAGRIVDELERIPGYDIEKGVAGTGVVALLGAEKSGPCVALRADMDALPIEEETGKPYASKKPGCMHACGHDGHIACLLGAAMVLSEIADELSGPVKLLFQPAEEMGYGGREMCEAGVLDDPEVSAVFALHCVPILPIGQIGIVSGAVMASSDIFRIRVVGLGSHAAIPHMGVDPIMVASQIVIAFQSIVSRSTDPLQSVVVTVGQFHAGTSSNIIPQTAEIEGTVRTLSQEVRENTLLRIEEIAKGVAEGLGAQAELEIIEGYPVLVNDQQATKLVVETATRALGAKAVYHPCPPVMAAEDFSYYAQRVPAAFWFLGICPPGVSDYPVNHNPAFDFVDEAIPTGVRMHCELVRSFMKQQSA